MGLGARKAGVCKPPIAPPSPTILAGLYKAMPEPQVLPCWLKNLPSVQENIGSIPGWGRSPGEGDGNPLVWRSQWTERPGRLQSMGLQSQTQLTSMPKP